VKICNLKLAYFSTWHSIFFQSFSFVESVKWRPCGSASTIWAATRFLVSLKKYEQTWPDNFPHRPKKITKVSNWIYKSAFLKDLKNHLFVICWKLEFEFERKLFTQSCELATDDDWWVLMPRRHQRVKRQKGEAFSAQGESNSWRSTEGTEVVPVW
jgi:hypothetical protein